MKKLLHVGCGPKRVANTVRAFNDGTWEEIRLDIDAAVRPDILGSMTDMSLIDDLAVDAIFSSHNIEHLYPHEVPIALSEVIRVLKGDGFCVITCPDLKSVSKLVLQDQLLEPAYISRAGPISPLDILYGHGASISGGNYFMSHRCGFTEKTLRQTLISSGFSSVATSCRPGSFDLWAIGCKGPRTESELRTLAQEYFFE
ncbi:MAG: methyltransferase domain-containing protein [Pseudomonadota bacterium]